MLRVVIPDSHGSYADPGAINAFISDLKFLDPTEIVMLGDHVDVSGIFSAHPRNYIEEMEYSYEEDCRAANSFLDRIQKAAPRAKIHYLEGNHEAHVERWISRTFTQKNDARELCDAMAPEGKLGLKRRDIKYYRTTENYMGLCISGAIKLGVCFFTHGSNTGRHATAAHLDSFSANVCHGHTHRSATLIRRTATSGEIGGFCPGTLSKLQPLYAHNSVSQWSHGYGVQLVEKSGRFLHINVPISRGRSLLSSFVNRIGGG